MSLYEIARLTTASSPESTSDHGGAYKTAQPVPRAGGERQEAPAIAPASEPDHETNHNAPTGETEVSRSRERLTHRGSANAAQPRVHSEGNRAPVPRASTSAEALVRIELSPKDADLLLRLQEAGVINVPGLVLADDDPRLADWTWEELEEYLRFKRRRSLAPGTVDQTLNWLRFLEDPASSHRWKEAFPPPPPVSLRPPVEQDWEEVITHYRANGKDGNTLNNHRLALKRLLEFLRRDRGATIPPWESLQGKIRQAEPRRPIPPDDLVPRFWAPDTELDPDPYLRRMWRAVFHFNFHAGLRPPSELADLKLSHVDFDSDRITYWEEKKDRWRDRVKFPTFVVSAMNGPSLRWYAEHVRPRVDKGRSDALFLNKQGDAWTHRAFGMGIGRVGKRVWPRFYGYCTRHWFATHFLIANDFNLKATADRLGDTTGVVEKHYLDEAKIRAELETKYAMPRFRGRSE